MSKRQNKDKNKQSTEGTTAQQSSFSCVWKKTEFNTFLKYYCKNTGGIEQRVVSVIPLVVVVIVIVLIINWLSFQFFAATAKYSREKNKWRIPPMGCEFSTPMLVLSLGLGLAKILNRG